MKKAPDFTLQDQNGVDHSLSQYRGKWLLVYFYPKDDTPGCTKEARSFRDKRAELEKNGIVVLGISADSFSSHKRFEEKHKLNFTLLSDPGKITIKAFGAYQENNFLGKQFGVILRNSYLINPEGNIVKEYLNVKPEDHASEIIADAQQLQ